MKTNGSIILTEYRGKIYSLQNTICPMFIQMFSQRLNKHC